MKTTLFIAIGILVGTVLLSVLLVRSPDAPPPPLLPPPEPQLPPQMTPQQSPAAADAEPAVAAPASPLPVRAEREAMEERIEESMDRLPAMSRLKLWWFTPGPKMNEEEYEKARGLYLRFLDNFARIKTARFHVEAFRILKDGTEEKMYEEEVILSGIKCRVDSTNYHGGQDPTTRLILYDGRHGAEWENGRKIETGRSGSPYYASIYMFGMERSLIREDSVVFMNGYTHCDIDDGTVGYSRLWNENGNEARFNTSNGLLMEELTWDGGTRTYSYQQVGDLWFPREVRRVIDRPDFYEGYRQVFSHVQLNEPIDDQQFTRKDP